MPRPRKDGTPATAANKRRLSTAFIETVRPNPSRPVAYWDTATPGLVLLVQPTGHRAFIYIYRVRRRGPRRFHIGNARSLSLSDARKMAMKLAYQVAEGADPHADRLALRQGSLPMWPNVTSMSMPARKTRATGKPKPWSQGTCATVVQTGCRQHPRADVKRSSRRSKNRCSPIKSLPRPVPSSVGACGRTSSRSTPASA